MSVQLGKKVSPSAMYPRLLSALRCHNSLPCVFMSKHGQQIMETNISVREESIAYGMLSDPLF
jgi:hypothetical protein